MYNIALEKKQSKYFYFRKYLDCFCAWEKRRKIKYRGFLFLQKSGFYFLWNIRLENNSEGNKKALCSFAFSANVQKPMIFK